VQPGETPETGQLALPEDIEQAVVEWIAYPKRGGRTWASRCGDST